MVLQTEDIQAYQIVVPADPSQVDEQAARVMQRYLDQMTGIELPIVAEGAPSRDAEIILGDTRTQRRLGVVEDRSVLGEDGFTIRTKGQRLVIVGGTGMGTLYGVYTFLEDYLGCRMYSPEVLSIPRVATISLPPIDDTQVPAIEFREVYYRHALDPEYAAWHKLDHHAEEWGLWVHTFGGLVPPDRYFDAHPEYFSLVNGKRIPSGQLCLTNDDVFDILVESLRGLMADKPNARYWSVSQNDTFGYCECDQCRAIDEREGTPAGSLLAFVNRVAAEFPDKIISTLAYQYSRAAPRTIRPADNVNIVLCTIELNRSRPIASDPGSESYRRDMEDWARICQNILIWDYVIQFSNLVSPFPNLRVLQPNLQYFVENHSVAMFQQGNREVAGEMAELRAYIIAKLLWNPQADVEAIVDDFLAGYYGDAAPFLRAYIDRMHDVLEESGEGLNIFGNPHTPPRAYLSAELLGEYDALFDRAEAATAADPAVLSRVRYARLPLHYTRLEQAKTRAGGEGGLFVREADEWQPRPEILERLDHFVQLANEQGVTRVTEWHTTPDEYGERYRQILERTPLQHLATDRPITYPIPYSPKYRAAGDQTLVDGLRGPFDHSYNWLGWEGQDMEAVVDLEQVRTIRRISTSFLQSTGSWIFLPLRVEFSASPDSVQWEQVGAAENEVDDRKSGVFAETFSVELDAAEARYVKVRAVSAKTCPDWHIGAGGPSWVFADEIAVD